jgi:hypothetical protein
MKLSSYEEFLAHDKTWNEENRKEALGKFPYTTVVEGVYPEMDFAHRWCWHEFGSPEYKQCYEYGSEYPACPLVLATEYIETGTYKELDGTEHQWKEKCYKEVEKHSHDGGNWTTVWLGKTGYDYGFSEYYFLNEVDRDAFVKEVPNMGLGEKYED